MNKILTLNLPFSFLRLFSLRISLKSFWYLAGLLIISLLVFYVFQVNTLMSENYQIQNYRQEIKKLTSENKILEIDSFQINSLENIGNKIKDLGFEKIDKVYYIQILESQMVSK